MLFFATQKPYWYQPLDSLAKYSSLSNMCSLEGMSIHVSSSSLDEGYIRGHFEAMDAKVREKRTDEHLEPLCPDADARMRLWVGYCSRSPELSFLSLCLQLFHPPESSHKVSMLK